MLVRVFANGPRGFCSIPGLVIPKTQKMVLDASLLNTQHYKLQWMNPRNGEMPFPTPWLSSYGKGTLQVTIDYGHQLYFTIFKKGYIRGSLSKFPFFFVWALLLIVHTWNSSPLRTKLLRLQCTCTVPATSGRIHGSPLVWVSMTFVTASFISSIVS